MRTTIPKNSIGKTEHLVTFDDPAAVPDGEGGYTETWTPLQPAQWFVRIRPATPKDAEHLTAGTVITHVSHLVHGRFHPGVSTRTRMTANGQVYQITSVGNVDARGLEMELVADVQG